MSRQRHRALSRTNYMNYVKRIFDWLETGFISIFRASRNLRICVVYVIYVRKRTFDWLVYWLHLDISSFEKTENVCSVCIGMCIRVSAQTNI